MKRRVLIVVQRYGAEVTGGSEAHARLAANRLARTHAVEVATTTALDYWTWAEHYSAGIAEVDGLRVHRFRVASGRDPAFKEFERRVLLEPHSLDDEEDWPRRQGPHSPELLEFLHREGNGYDAILFYTYIYEPTVRGLPLVPERSALISTAHDEAPLRLAPYRALFHLPRACGFLTPEERGLVRATFRNEQVPDVVLGIGLDAPPAHDAEAFRRTHGLDGPLVVYLGQVSEGKGCDELIAAWSEMREAPGAPRGTLVLVGTVRMDLPARDDVVALGRVDDAEKFGALAAADALVLPSRFESLGIVLLEAWQAGTPVLVPAHNAVTAGQTRRSGGGIVYDSLPHTLRDVVSDGDGLRALGARGRDWTLRESSMEAFDARLGELVELASHEVEGTKSLR